MLIKNLSLKNIRSYKDLALSFEKGATLLSGDIGSGKSTILLSIEFALFGLMKGSVSGASLLRNGEDLGEVYLNLEISKKDITIYRSLKRASSAIVQDKCSITIDGEEIICTPIELKAKILELLGYSLELLKKSKSMIYRYTVYTPQEEMKQIITESSSDRLEKLRKIFDVDKYNLVKENTSILVKELKNEVRIYKNEIFTLQQDLFDIDELKEQINIYEKELEKINKNYEDLLKNEKSLKEEVVKIQELEKELAVSKNKKSILAQQINSTKSLINQIKQSFDDLKEPKKVEFDKSGVEELNKKLEVFEEKFTLIEEKLSTLKNKKAIFAEKINDSNNLIKNIDSLEECPKCLQKVDESHKGHVEKEEKKKIGKLTNNIKLIDEKIELILEKKSKVKKGIDLINEKKSKLLIQEQKHLDYKKSLDEYKQKLQKKKAQETKINELEKEIKEKQKEHDSIKIKEIDSQKNKDLKQSLEEISLSIRSSIEKSSSFKEKISSLKEKIVLAEKKKKKIQDLNKVIESQNTDINWLENHFSNILGVIEKNVLNSLHYEFNERFKEWFNILLEDDTISAQLQEDFSVLINQNGFDIEVSDLSGGEKTSVALAYRLALNKVINDYLTNIKTRDIIILDEPTDGFSFDQLDKVRDVLEKLDSKQTIIVSHEPKLETFVDKIVKISKQEHVSQVV
ncbi:MAG: AAA family ATPase [Candidatus Woesearchaeota archaeon]